MTNKQFTGEVNSFNAFENNGGLNTSASPLSVKDFESTDLQNVELDIWGSIKKRSGYLNLNDKAINYGGVDDYTTLMLHCDGTDEGTTFTDSSDHANTVTAEGDANTATAVKKFGTASMELDGTGDYVTVPSDQKLTNGSFETWTGLTDLLTDGGMETWTNPTTLTNWTFAGAGGTLARDGTTKKVGTYSALVTRVTGNAEIYQQFASPATYANKTLVVSGWVYSLSGGNTISVFIGDGVGGSSAYHTGSGWEFLSTTLKIAAVPSYVSINLRAYNVNGVFANFDDVKVYEQLPPTGWTLSGTGATVVREEGTIKVGTYSAKLTRNGTNCKLTQIISATSAYAGKTVTLGAWVYATVASRARITINDGVGETDSSYHSGVAGWEYLTVTRTCSASATTLRAFLNVITGDTTAYFDGAFAVTDDAANFNFGSSPWAVDTWVNYSVLPSVSETKSFFTLMTEIDGHWAQFYLNNNAGQYRLIFQNFYGGVLQNSLTANIDEPSVDTWYHAEMDIYDGYIYFFWDGELVGSSALTTATFYPYDGYFVIGSDTETNGINGYLDEFRVSKGIARHTADFDVPVRAYDATTSVPSGNGLYYYENSSGNDYLVAVFGTNIFKMDALDGTFDDITGGLTLTAASSNRCQFTSYGDILYGTNGTNPPFTWTGTGDAAVMTVPTNLTTAKCITNWTEYTFLGNVTVDGTLYSSRIYWSAVGDPTTWDAADWVNINKNDGQDIVNIAPLGDKLIIFKERSIYVGMFTGDTDIPFIFAKSPSHVGCIARDSVQMVNNGLIFLSYDGFYYFDGSNSLKISNNISVSLRDDLTKASLSKVVSTLLMEKNQYICFMPDSTVNDVGYIWDFYTKAWMKFTGASVNAMTTINTNNEQTPYFLDYSGFCYKMNTGTNDYPLGVETAIDSYYKTKWFSFGDLMNKKGVPTVMMYLLHSTATLTVGYSYDFDEVNTNIVELDLSGEAGSVYDTAVYDVDTYGSSEGGFSREIDLMGRGRVFRLSFENNKIDETFTIYGFGISAFMESAV